MSHSIDVIIPNYNGARYLRECLGALEAQTRDDWRALIVDDASTDDSVALLAAELPQHRVLALPKNGGFVQAVNAGIAATQAPFVVLLNNDTAVEPDFLAECVGALEARREYAAAAAKLVLYAKPTVIHTTGDGYDWDGVPFSRGVWEEDRGQYDAMDEVFGGCGGAVAYRRAALEEIALSATAVFDPALIMYCEDVELNLRLRRAGLRTLYAPKARVRHHLSATGGGKLASFYNARNQPRLWAQHMPPGAVGRAWPRFVRSQVAAAAAATRHWRGEAARATLRGQVQGLRAFPGLWRKRRFSAQEAANLLPWIGRAWL